MRKVKWQLCRRHALAPSPLWSTLQAYTSQASNELWNSHPDEFVTVTHACLFLLVLFPLSHFFFGPFCCILFFEAVQSVPRVLFLALLSSLSDLTFSFRFLPFPFFSFPSRAPIFCSTPSLLSHVVFSLGCRSSLVSLFFRLSFPGPLSISLIWSMLCPLWS